MSGYCFRCGAVLHEDVIEGRHRLVCPQCDWVYYPQLKVSAAAYVEKDGRLLLARRAQQPWQGCWYLPAGYVEADERPEQAAERETYEETGLRVQARSLEEVIYFDDDPRGNGLLLVYACELVDGVLTTSRETLECAFFAPDCIPQPLTGAGHVEAIQKWVRTQTEAG